MFKDQTILITGGTGSLGKKLVKYFLSQTQAKKIIVFSRDELKQSQMQKILLPHDADDRLRFFIGDVRDLQRLRRALHGVDIVIHTAALKQVPALEYNPIEAIKTNIYGSQNVVEASIDEGVKKVLLISTDKAAQPINLYGATKLAAEKLFIAANSYGAGKTVFSAVRYGNVIGSRGSIVDLLLNSSEADKIGITHPEMTRFWITLDQAVELVVFALENMEGGEIFIPKIPSMKLIDLFEAITPGVNRAVTGIRPGEKIHEDLVNEHESACGYELENNYVILPQFIFFAEGVYGKYKKAGKKLSEGFSYKSNQNDKWLDKDEIAKIVKELTIG